MLSGYAAQSVNNVFLDHDSPGPGALLAVGDVLMAWPA